MIEAKPELIIGGNYTDERGLLEFFNDFDTSPVKRIYFTTHFDINTIRAWQGHRIECRWFICVKGSFSLKLVKIDDWDNPSDNLEVYEYQLEASKQQILYMPKGFANGFKANEKDSKLMMMSDYGFNESVNDQVRFDKNKWYNWDNI